jgi:hypothetical protein
VLVQLHFNECLGHCLHQLVLCSRELLHLWAVIVGIVGLSVAGLAIAVIIPCVHHLTILIRNISILESKRNPKLYDVIFIYLY